MSRPRPGLDWFRLIAGLLVVANHTSPLLSYTVEGDFLLTRVLARLAVPFFLMVSGYFVFSRYAADRDEGPAPLLKFLKQMGILYGVAILLYLPLTIYTGQLTDGNLAANIFKSLIFNGTIYHLWYMPAAIIGGVIVWLLYKTCKPRVVLGITAALYIVGLLGDSYYGLAQGVPALSTAYEGLFTVFDYTRNGLFLAPLFLAVGALVGAKPRKHKATPMLAGFLVTLCAMAAEAVLLNNLGWQRHDSMYILLAPCIFFLFCFLLTFEGEAPALLRNASMALYIVHPWVIVLVRGGAKAMGAEALFIDNSLLHYLAVCIISLIVSLLFAYIMGRWSQRKAPCQNALGFRWTYRP